MLTRRHFLQYLGILATGQVDYTQLTPEYSYSQLVELDKVYLYTDPENCPPCKILETNLEKYGELPFELEIIITSQRPAPKFLWDRFHEDGQYYYIGTDVEEYWPSS